MKWSYALSSLLFLIFLLNLIMSTLAFEVKPANISDEELMERVKNDPTTEVKVSFWQLPLWIKIHHIVTVIAGILAAWKLLPFVVTKIKSVLASRKRRKILKIIMENPGISIKELQEVTGEDRSTLRYHLRLLEEEGLIVSIKAGNNLLLFLIGQNLPNSVALKSERKKEILEILGGNEMTAREIAEALGVDLKTVYYHLNELRKAGLIKADRGSYRVCLEDE